MKVFLTSLALCALVAAATSTCISKYQSMPCLAKTAMPVWAQGYFGDGDPCFTLKGQRKCFIFDTGTYTGCDCTADCGCSSGVAVDPCADYSLPSNGCECNKYSKFNDDNYENDPEKFAHTMCDTSICGGVNTSNCGRVCYRGETDFTAADKQAVLDAHNKRRAIVARGDEARGYPNGPQPSAADMMELQWDDELAKIAQKWADQCQGGHDKHRQTDTFSNWVGQNYANFGSSAFDSSQQIDYLVKMWYDEVADFPPGNVNSYSNAGANGTIGHYTAMVWARTTHVGCGFIKYHQGGWYRQAIVCNYGPGGNVRSQPMYNNPGATCVYGTYTSGTMEGLCRASAP